MNPSFVLILLLVAFIAFCSLLHFYLVSRVLDRYYEQEIKPDRERMDELEGRLRELEA